jgi:hypothetical protein
MNPKPARNKKSSPDDISACKLQEIARSIKAHPNNTPEGVVIDTIRSQAWSEGFYDGVLRTWSEDLSVAVGTKDPMDWRFAGSGVILFSDEPELCHELIRRVVAEAGFNLWVEISQGGQTVPPLMKLQKRAPALVLLKPGRWHIPRKMADQEIEVNTSEVMDYQEGLTREICGFNPAHPVIPVICLPTDQESSISETLRRPGLFDRFIKLKSMTLEQRGKQFIEEIGRGRCGESILAAPGKVGFALKQWFGDARLRALAVLHLQRVHRRSDRHIEMTDILDVALRGVVEMDQREIDGSTFPRNVVAIHEAGHAVVSIIDSAGENLPDYCTVIPGGDFEGVVVGSLEFHQLKDASLTYAKFRHLIRVSLAGRAAEELAFGPEHVTNGATSDLETCFRRSSQAFMNYGFAPDMESSKASGSNLAVVIGQPSHSEFAHIEGLVRKFLADQYAEVCKMLTNNRKLLDAVADRMLWDPVVDQSELKEIWRRVVASDIDTESELHRRMTDRTE